MIEPTSICDCTFCDLKPLFFDHVEDRELRDICQNKRELSYPAGEVIIRQGEEIRDFFYLKSGLVKLYNRGTRKDQIIKIAGPFDFVSMISVITDKNFRYSVSALEDSTICLIDIRVIKKLVRVSGGFALHLIEKLTDSNNDIVRTNLEIRERNLRGRVAYVLLFFSRKVYGSNVFEMPITRKEFGEFIDMSTENVIRILSELRKDKVLKIFGKSIEILHPEHLDQLSAHG